MKTYCVRCNRKVKINMSLINQKIREYFIKTDLYMCGWCRRRLRIINDADATIKKLKEIQKEKAEEAKLKKDKESSDNYLEELYSGKNG